MYKVPYSPPGGGGSLSNGLGKRRQKGKGKGEGEMGREKGEGEREGQGNGEGKRKRFAWGRISSWYRGREKGTVGKNIGLKTGLKLHPFAFKMLKKNPANASVPRNL